MCSRICALLFVLFTLQEFRGRIVFWKRCNKREEEAEGSGERSCAFKGVTRPVIGVTDFFQCSCFLADGHNGPDEDLQAAGRTYAHTQRFAPPRIHVGAVVERRVVHLHEDKGQDELETQMGEWSQSEQFHPNKEPIEEERHNNNTTGELGSSVTFSS